MILALLLAAAGPVVHYAEVAGSVDPGSGAFLIAAIHDAEDKGAEALVVRLDTPGGLLSTTRDVVQAELSAKVPIVFWVGPPGARAGSAGVFLTLAAHVAAMAPSTSIGAAHPVGIGGSDEKNDEKNTMFQKVENDTASFVKGIAERRSRNVEWAEKAVRQSESVTASKALDLHVIDQPRRSAPRAQAREFGLERGERTLHAAFDVIEIVRRCCHGFPRGTAVLTSRRCRRQPTKVARPLPARTAAIAPGSRIENTMIGIRFSRASAKAVASMTLRSRRIASSWVSRS